MIFLTSSPELFAYLLMVAPDEKLLDSARIAWRNNSRCIGRLPGISPLLGWGNRWTALRTDESVKPAWMSPRVRGYSPLWKDKISQA
jgi:hypothetical protein